MEIKLTILFWSITTIATYYFIEFKKIKRNGVPLLAITTIMGLGITHVFLLSISKDYNIYSHNGNETLDMNATGQVGDFIGGVIGTLLTGLSVILLYKTLMAQNSSSIENRFFELLKFHRDNVNEIEFRYYTKSKKIKTVKGRHFFVSAEKQLKNAFTEFDIFFKSKAYQIESIYISKYYEETRANILVEKKFDNLYILSKIDICYLILLFGVSRDGVNEILEKTSNKYNKEFIEDLLEYFRMKPVSSSTYYHKWCALLNTENPIKEIDNIRKERKENGNISTKSSNYYPDNYDKFYGGHRFRLGHYFRHLYQIACFVHYNQYLTEEEKIGYMRIVRGQLSDYEQRLFFYNSISQLGKNWEISDSTGKSIETNNRLITKYGIIKTISMTPLADGLKPEQIYPLKLKASPHF
ncbi:putative phage abortive infection protein [Sphingobacterium thalpophilum]|uniref:Phage abortive infection protein n=1 Tax=Sphingobacterium thalpophilum TaxID=259 RepID=A0A4U9VP78_9SPHI|nr:putative phage abortive infection protein [Sphingobacterium thalpophilum]VTR49135.1 Uncharacterised protein [Sphingobacterium thalpophilum]